MSRTLLFSLALLVVLSVVHAQREQKEGRAIRTRPKEILPPKRGEKIKPGSLAPPLSPELRRFTKTMSLENLDHEKIRYYFTKRRWVTRLVDCIVNVGYCNTKVSYQLHNRVVNASSFQGDYFAGFSRAAKLRVLQAIIIAVTALRNDFPDQWDRIEQTLKFLDERSDFSV